MSTGDSAEKDADDGRRRCPESGHMVSTSGGRHEPRCVSASCRYVGPGVPVPLDERIAEARAALRNYRQAEREAAIKTRRAQWVLDDLMSRVTSPGSAGQ